MPLHPRGGGPVKVGLAEVRTEIGTLDTRLSTQIAGVRTKIANLKTMLIRWIGRYRARDRRTRCNP